MKESEKEILTDKSRDYKLTRNEYERKRRKAERNHGKDTIAKCGANLNCSVDT